MTDYTDLITSEHNDKPNFSAVVSALTSSFSDLIQFYSTVTELYDIDNAVGKQLDVVGEWVGRSRRIATPLTGVYFSWDDTVLTGWNSGIWKGPFDPSSGLTNLPDDSYRLLLKAKIAANQWDGSINAAYEAWSNIFQNGEFIIIQDNQDMSFDLVIGGTPLSAVDKIIITQGYLPLKPEGVRIANYFQAYSTGPVFSWDSEDGSGTYLAGWGTGEWATLI